LLPAPLANSRPAASPPPR